MPRVKNKKLRKLREYRDKLLAKITDLESGVRERDARMIEIREAIASDNTLRAYALSSPFGCSDDADWKKAISLNDAVTELTFIYRLLAMERDFTLEVDKAIKANDLLRARALVEQHQYDQIKHDNLLQSWGEVSGFVRHLRNQLDESLEGRK